MTALPQSDSGTTQQVKYRLILFVANDEPNSRAARANIGELCEEELCGRCDLKIVDVLKDLAAAAEHGVLVTPTLLVRSLGAELTIIGNLSDQQKLRAALQLEGT